MLVQRFETLHHILLETFECVSPWTSTKYPDEVAGELEGSRFKLETLAWRICQHEPKVNVHDVALLGNNQVRIVSVFDL